VDSSGLYLFGFGLILVGVIILMVAAILATRGKSGKTKTAGVIIIGPVPIVFGSDKKTAKTLMTLGIVLTVAIIVAMLIYYYLIV
jgi:uncharacterized protein (TIGR00304 family)